MQNKKQDIFCIKCKSSLKSGGLVASAQEMEYLCCGYCKTLYSFSIDSSSGSAVLIVRPLNLPEADTQSIFHKLRWTKLQELLRMAGHEAKPQKEVAVLTSTAIGVALSLDEWKKEIEEATSVADFLKRMGQ